MAENTIPVPSFDLGIENSAVYGNLKDAESFLSGTDTVLPSGEIEKNIPKKEEKEEHKKEEPKEDFKDLSGEDIAEVFLGEEVAKKTIKDAVEEPDEDLSQFESLTQELYKAGIFNAPEGEEPKIAKTAEEFATLFNEEKQAGASQWLEGYLSRFGEDRKEMFEAIFVNGVDPKEYLPTFNEVQSFENIDLELESNQELIVRSYYKKAGWSDDKINNKIEKLKSFADLEDESKTIHPILLGQEKEKLSVLSENKAEEQKNIIQADTEYKNSISKLLQDKVKEKQFDGIPLTEKDAQKAFDFLYSKKWKTKSGELLTDFDKFILDSKHPDNHSKRIKLALLELNNFDFSKIEKKAISKESNTLFSSLIHQKEKKINKQPVSQSWNNL